MSSQIAPVTLADLQLPVRTRLDRVPQELRRIVEADFGLIAEVNTHLFQMQGKMFRPTLLLLADQATGGADPGPSPSRPWSSSSTWPRWSTTTRWTIRCCGAGCRR